MKALLDRFNTDRDDYTEKGWNTYLTNILTESKDMNYYQIFGLKPGHTIDNKATTKTYRALSKWLHPDKNHDKLYTDVSTELFKMVQNAYETLSNPAKELSYRQTLPRETDTSHKSNTTSKYRAYSTARHPDFTSGSFDFSGVFGKSFSNVAFSNVTMSVDGTSTFFSNSHSNSEPAKVINRDVMPNETVSTKNGDIIIKGNVFGLVKSMAGNITVEGFVSGTVKTMSGNNCIHKGIKKGGTVKTMSGNNSIYGSAQGAYSTMSGRNHIYSSFYEQSTTVSNIQFKM